MAYEARLKAVCRRAAYRGEGGEMRTTARARARAPRARAGRASAPALSRLVVRREGERAPVCKEERSASPGRSDT